MVSRAAKPIYYRRSVVNATKIARRAHQRLCDIAGLKKEGPHLIRRERGPSHGTLKSALYRAPQGYHLCRLVEVEVLSNECPCCERPFVATFSRISN